MLEIEQGKRALSCMNCGRKVKRGEKRAIRSGTRIKERMTKTGEPSVFHQPFCNRVCIDCAEDHEGPRQLKNIEKALKYIARYRDTKVYQTIVMEA